MDGTIVGEDTDLMILQVRTARESETISTVADMPGCKGAAYNTQVSVDASNDTIYVNAKRTFRRALSQPTKAMDAPTINGSWWVDAINAEDAWDITTGSPDVTLAVVDSGLPEAQAILDESRVQRIDHIGTSITDDDSIDAAKGYHGVWVTGFAAGSVSDPDNYDSFFHGGTNVMGVDHNATVVFVDIQHPRLDDEGNPILDDEGHKVFDTAVLSGIKAAIPTSDVINISWGPNISECTEETCRQESRRTFRFKMSSALKMAREKQGGALLVFSAGNDAIKDDDQLLEETDPAYEGQWRDYTMVVGASDEKLLGGYKDAAFSRNGSVVDLFAPGEQVGFAQDDVNVYKDTHEGNGTSYAAPLVAGAATLVKSVEPSLRPAEIKHLLLDSAPATVNTDNGDRKHLDLKSALESALLLRDTDLHTMPAVAFTAKDDTQDLELPVSIPASGVSAMDVLFLVDASGSYGDDIATMQANSAAILNDMSSRGFDVAFGVAAFSDFPLETYGDPAFGDEAFYLLQSITTDTDEATNGINALTTYYGLDGPESQLEALYQCATGAGRDINGDGDYDDAGELLPRSIGWRAGTQRVIVFSTDARFHDSATEPEYPGPTMAETIAALQAANIMVIGLESGTTIAQMGEIVNATGGIKDTLSSDSSGIVESLAAAIDTSTASLDISYQVVAGQEFVSGMTPAEGYVDQAPGETVTFTAHLTNPRQPGTKAQNNDVLIWIKADGSVIGRVHIPVQIPVAAE
jgi:hypothetical protein